MPYPRKYASPPEQLRAQLAACRDQGMDFDAAWGVALGTYRQRGTVRLPHPTPERRAWKETFAETRDEWRASFNSTPTPFSQAIERALALVRDEDERAVAAIPAGAGPMRLAYVLPPRGIATAERRRRVAA